jgi:hypothetical protein
VYEIVKTKNETIQILAASEEDGGGVLLATIQPKEQTNENNGKVVMEIFDSKGDEVASLQKKIKKKKLDEGLTSPSPPATPTTPSSRRKDDSLRLYTQFSIHPEQEAKKVRTRTGPVSLYLWGQIDVQTKKASIFGEDTLKWTMEVPMSSTSAHIYSSSLGSGKQQKTPLFRLPFANLSKMEADSSTSSSSSQQERIITLEGTRCATLRLHDDGRQQVEVQPNTDPVMMLLFLAASNQIF